MRHQASANILHPIRVIFKIQSLTAVECFWRYRPSEGLMGWIVGSIVFSECVLCTSFVSVYILILRLELCRWVCVGPELHAI